MSIGVVALLVGLFVIPLIILGLGHRLRRRSPTQRRVFWGALVGYLVAALAAMWVGMVPAAEWSNSDTVRGLLGFWGLLVGPLIGAAAAVASKRRGDP
ncbi:MAG: hypothetical protein ACREOK_09625 [Gemmatimonadaceae bacterium]